jgi:hypothetical protein
MKTFTNNTRSGKQVSGIGVLIACGGIPATGLTLLTY